MPDSSPPAISSGRLHIHAEPGFMSRGFHHHCPEEAVAWWCFFTGGVRTFAHTLTSTLQPPQALVPCVQERLAENPNCSTVFPLTCRAVRLIGRFTAHPLRSPTRPGQAASSPVMVRCSPRGTSAFVRSHLA